jgi:hypothetical protein
MYRERNEAKKKHMDTSNSAEIEHNDKKTFLELIVLHLFFFVFLLCAHPALYPSASPNNVMVF